MSDEVKDEGSQPLKIEAEATIEAGKGAENGASALPRFSMVANTGAMMRLAGWKYPVVMDLEGMSIPSQMRPIRYGHDAMHGVGHTTSLKIVDGQLMAEGVISRDTPAARDVASSAKNGFPWQASVGASADQVEFVKEGQSVAVNGQQFNGPLNVVRRSTLGEISFVDLGADGNTSVRVAAMKDGEKDNTQTIDDDQIVGQAVKRAKAERARRAAIEALGAEYSEYAGVDLDLIGSIQQEAIESGASAKDTETKLLRATRPIAPGIRRADLPTPAILEASLCMSLGVSDEVLAKDRDYGPDVVSKAWPLRNRGLRGTIAAALEASGVRVPHGSRELFTAVLQHRDIRAEGFSTVNLPGILGNVANKILLTAFTAVNATYDLIADQADFANFHTHAIYRLDHLGEFAKVPPDGEIKHGSLDQSAYSNKLDTYGQMLTITRQDIINDDLNAFRSLTAGLARKARIAVEKALYTVVCEGSDVFYTTGRGNLLTGALGITELADAEAALTLMADASGDPIYATPRFLLVPPALKYLADAIFTSTNLGSFLLTLVPGTATAYPDGNPFRGRFQVVSSPYLSSTAITGNSATTWYLLADPLMLPAFQVAYLDGRRAPTIETADAEFNTLGLQMRCYFDFGVAQLDYRGAIKNTAS